jgi:ankyrin repeat protein
MALREGDDHGLLPIHAAASNGSLSLEHIRCLVEARPDSVRDRDAEGHLPLRVVVARRSRHAHALAIARFLLKLHPESIRDGANVQEEEEEENRYLPVHAALDNGAPLAVVRFFVRRYRESLEQWTGSGSLALHLAVSTEAPPETIEFLVQQCPQAVRAVERDRTGGSLCTGQRALGTRSLEHCSTSWVRGRSRSCSGTPRD